MHRLKTLFIHFEFFMFLLLFFLSLIMGPVHAQPTMSQGVERTNVFIPAAPSPSEPWHHISTIYADIQLSAA